jgi:peptidyl-prolyl cis-trans isomerase D
MKRFRSYCFRFLPIIGLCFVIGCGGEGKKSSNPNVVATYAYGEITADSLNSYITKQFEGNKVAGDPSVPVTDRIPRTMEVYSGLIRKMVLDDMVNRKVKEKQLDNRNNIRHALKHAEERITLRELHSEIHERNKIPVSDTEIQQYYDKNRSRFGNKPLYDVSEQIKRVLVEEKEPAYVEKYISELKDTATITKNYEILRIPEPSAEDLRTAYEKSKEMMYREPQKWIIEQLELEGSKAKENAEKAWAKLGSGESLNAVAGSFGRDVRLTTIEHKGGPPSDNFDKVVTSLNPGEFSRPFEKNGKYFLARLKEKIPAPYIPFEKVKEGIHQSLRQEREKKLYQERKAQTLFTVHGRLYSLEDFYQEFKEMPVSEQKRYSAYEERTKLVDRMIARLLLLEDSYDRMLNAKNKEEIEKAGEHYLSDVFHDEEVDHKMKVKAEEIKEYYEEDKKHFQSPTRVKLSVIVVRGSRDEAADKKARKKIEEAYTKLKPGLFKKGMRFEEVAKRYSEDPRTARSGGEIPGWVRETDNPQVEMEDHAFHEKVLGMDAGEISKPIPSKGSYVIVKVREKELPRQQSFEEIKEYVKKDVVTKKHDDLTAKLNNDMMNQAKLVIHEGALKSMINRTNNKKEVGAAK